MKLNMYRGTNGLRTATVLIALTVRKDTAKRGGDETERKNFHVFVAATFFRVFAINLLKVATIFN